MQAHQGQPHYAPASVGALMETAFLRDAMIDANGGGRRVERSSFATLRLRWQRAMRSIALAFRRA